MEELLETNKSLKQDEVKYEQVIQRWEARERRAQADLEKEIADLRELGAFARTHDVRRTHPLQNGAAPSSKQTRSS